MAASAVPRLIAVVVLPTPPFWLATARTRGDLCASVARARSGAAKSASGGDEMAALVMARLNLWLRYATQDCAAPRQFLGSAWRITTTRDFGSVRLGTKDA